MVDTSKKQLMMTTEQETDRTGNSDIPPFVVGVGASAGGLEALERLFENVPSNSGLAFVVVQHLSPDFKSLMDELLARHTEIDIFRVQDEMPVRPNSIYLIPAKKNMVLRDGRLHLIDQETGGLNLPIDIFLHSLAEDMKHRAIAVILSGTGSDGSRGVRAIRAAGGFVMVQSIQSAAFDGMPKSALSTGTANVVCAPDSMASRIMEYVNSPTTFVNDVTAEAVNNGDELSVIFRMFRNQYGLDFSFYKPNTIARRLERRLHLSRCDTLIDYVGKIEEDPRELDLLYRDLLVEVTQFFRDPEAFQRLRDQVVPALVAKGRESGELRVWTPGCATGEEAYSIAMLVQDCLDRQQVSLDFKLFATDVHLTSMETASSGVYSSQHIQRMPLEFRDRYFTRIGDLYHISAELRQRVIFAPHDITKDPPFTRIDLISCRNVLIYLEPDVQRRIVSLFHFGLNVDGFLFLGPSENIGDLEKELEPVDRTWRIFRKLRNVRLPSAGPISSLPPFSRVVISRPSYVSMQTRGDKNWLVPEVYDHLLSKYVPPSLLINEHLELVHSFGDARRLLVQPEGKATLDVLRMVEGELRVAMSAAIHKAATTDTNVVFEGVRAKTDSEERRYRLIAERYNKSTDKLYLISLEEMAPTGRPEEASTESYNSADQSALRITALERELNYTKETLQATVEELETSNEELQSTNEELVASNEELQSTNEELHSVNEELYTVNAEHQKKIGELTKMTEDMDNLFRSTEIGTVLLDEQLHIRKFTPAVTQVLHVIDQDVGRPIGHIAHRLRDFDLVADVQQVLATQLPLERGVECKEGRAYLIRVLPYRTDGDTKGVTLTILDVSSLVNAQRHCSVSANRAIEEATDV